MEHDPVEILESVKVCMAKALDKATAAGYNVDNGLKAIGLTNQRETTLVWSKSTGFPLHHAIVWMDARTSSICRYLVFHVFRLFYCVIGFSIYTDSILVYCTFSILGSWLILFAATCFVTWA